MDPLNPSAFEIHSPTHKAVVQLDELAAWLYPDPSPHVLTLRDFRHRYPLTGLGDPAARAIEQSRRINQAIGDFSQRGLCEYQIGLIYLYWGKYRSAARQFQLAQRQWTFLKNQASHCLAHFAEGIARQLAHQYEVASVCYGRAEHYLAQLQNFPHPGTPDEFVQDISRYLNANFTALQQVLWQVEDKPDEDANTYYGLPNPSDYGEQCQWYKIQRKNNKFLPQISEDLLLLVDKLSDNYEVAADNLYVVYKENAEGEILLQSLSPQPQPFRRIYLGTPTTTLTGKFARLDGIHLSDVQEVPLTDREKLGIVVGFWHRLLLHHA
ncbi:MAG TPA: hypothetical protein EYH05_01255 [Anaerolineae bacterium]|nr:hypothetical protein [Anaerolineae bacterium]